MRPGCEKKKVKATSRTIITTLFGDIATASIHNKSQALLCCCYNDLLPQSSQTPFDDISKYVVTM